MQGVCAVQLAVDLSRQALANPVDTIQSGQVHGWMVRLVNDCE